MKKKNKQKFITPYIKEKNLLYFPLFCFNKRRPKKFIAEWHNKKGKYRIICQCTDGVPGALEMDVYAVTLRLFFVQKRPVAGVKVDYSEIAKMLGLKPLKNWVSKIKKALFRLSDAVYTFEDGWIRAHGSKDKPWAKKINLFQKREFFIEPATKKKGRRKQYALLTFPEEILLNIEASHFQFLDFAWFKALPTGIPRRLYEYLAWNRYKSEKSGFFIVSEKEIIECLPLTDKNATTRRKTMQKAIDALILVRFLKKSMFDKKKKVYKFFYDLPKLTDKIITVDTLPKKLDESMQKKSPGPDPAGGDLLEGLLGKIQPEKCKTTITGKLRRVIEQTYQEKGFEYVQSNILYANKHAKKRYSVYLQKALAEDWAEETRENRPESPEEKKQLAIEQAWNNLSESARQEIKQEFEDYLQSYGNAAESLRAAGGVWPAWLAKKLSCFFQ